ncbi:sigma-70 family RNA polymerase sigma factor [Kitasatospora sp. NBC_01287]|uniref:sigma-70 family RNA polymerase sigma factor n=1 Tax=Kitasatospora sp. NBC_01287 TaxID=2903573 RepID=UPI00224D1232|nr:sigma-70 family RNA polymerase sigma factor [Kitasatospora sp. NBC_01287]MCX4751108.1 sigma-70 family RNA polymerase sigma factor [Kitasatospora sp. NBC_01287]
MAGEASTAHQDPPALTQAQAERLLAGLNEVVRAGEEARQLRAEMIKLLAGLGWTQERIARLTDMSQAAVSKQVSKARTEDPPPPPPPLSLDQPDTPWLEGRLWGLAEEISEACDGDARCTRHLSAIARGRQRFTPRSVDELRRLVEADLTLRRDLLPSGYRAAYDEISRRLDTPAKAIAGGTGTADGLSASARRTLAHQIQRDQLHLDRTP